MSLHWLDEDVKHLDILDQYKGNETWRPCRVLKLGSEKVRVHFVGFGKEYDTEIYLRKEARRIAPLFSRSKPPIGSAPRHEFLGNLKAGDYVDVWFKELERWITSEIAADLGDYILIRSGEPLPTRNGSRTVTRWFPCNSTEMAPASSLSTVNKGRGTAPGSCIGAKGAKAFADALKEHKQLTHVHLCSNAMGDEGAKALADALKEHKQLTYLNLQVNSIGDEGAKALAHALKEHKQLTYLDLGRNKIDNEGAKALADALKEHKQLTYLNLGFNSIGDEGAKALAHALKEHKQLTYLDLGRNKIGNEGAKALADALEETDTGKKQKRKRDRKRKKKKNKKKTDTRTYRHRRKAANVDTVKLNWRISTAVKVDESEVSSKVVNLAKSGDESKDDRVFEQREESDMRSEGSDDVENSTDDEWKCKHKKMMLEAERYGVSSPVVNELLLEAIEVCNPIVRARNADCKESDDCDHPLSTLFKQYRALQEATLRVDSFFRASRMDVGVSVESLVSASKELSDSRSALHQHCHEIQYASKNAKQKAFEKPKLAELLRNRDKVCRSAQQAVLSVEETMSRVTSTVKQGVALLKHMCDTFPIVARQSPVLSSAKRENDFEIPDFGAVLQCIEEAYNAYTKARIAMLTGVDGAPIQGVSAMVSKIRSSQQLNTEYRGAVDKLIELCEDAIGKGNLLSSNLHHHTKLATSLLEQRCAELRTQLVTMQKDLGKVTREIAFLKAPVARMASLLRKKTHLLSAEAVSGFKAKDDEVVNLKIDMETVADRILRLERHHRPTERDREKRNTLFRKFEEARSDRQYQAFRRGVRALMRDLPELRVRYPMLSAVAQADVATVGIDMFRIADESDMREGMNTVRRASVVAKDSLDLLGIPHGTEVVLKHLQKGGERALSSVVAGLSKLEHPSVISLLGVTEQYDAKECAMRTSLIFPLYEHGDMRNWLETKCRAQWHSQRSESKKKQSKSESNLSLTERRERAVVQCLRPVLEGLEYLHARGVLHCDLKPENILLDRDGRGVLCDLDGFRVAAVTGGQLGGSEAKGYRVTKNITLGVSSLQRQEFGTDGYRDPHLKEFSASSDVYAMGIILAECLLGWDALNHGDSREAHDALRQAVVRGADIAKNLDKSTRQLLSRMLSADENKRPSVQKVLEHPFFRGRPVLRECVVCCDDEVPVHGGVQCGQGHFVCDACVQEHVMEFANHEAKEWDAPKFKKTTGQVPCCAYKCKCTYTDQQVFDHLPDKGKGWKLLVGARSKVLEGDLNRQIEQQMEAKFDRKLEEWKRMSEREREVATHRRHIINEIINLKCPRCRRVFLDFNGCFALSCSGKGGCSCAFCAWCLKDCGSDAHAHVRSCPHSLNRGDYYGNVNLFDEAHKQRRLREIRQYLSSIDPKIAGDVVASCLKDWLDIGLGELARELG